MAVHFGTPTAGGGLGTSFTISHTTTNFANRRLIVAIAVGSPVAWYSNDIPATYGGQALTTLVRRSTSEGDVDTVVAALDAPPVGTADLVVPFQDGEVQARILAFPAHGIDLLGSSEVIDSDRGSAASSFHSASVGSVADPILFQAVGCRPATDVTPESPFAALGSVRTNYPEDGDSFQATLQVASRAWVSGVAGFGAAFADPVSWAAVFLSFPAAAGADQPDAATVVDVVLDPPQGTSNAILSLMGR